MTRATLLHVLDRPTALGPAEVRELEQLAQAFPYCQTAHLLLAKAAHDQGTMLAGQRLRRAATYAADRALLRRLIEQVEPAVVPETLVKEVDTKEPVATPETTVPAVPAVVSIPAISAPTEIAAPVAAAPLAEPQLISVVVAPVILPLAAPEVTAPVEIAPVPALAAEVSVVPTAVLEPVLPVPIAEPLPAVVAPVETIAALAPAAPTPATAAPELPEPEIEIPAVPTVANGVAAEVESAPIEPDLPVLIDQEGVRILAAISVVESEPEALEEELPIATALEIEPVVEPDLPAQAPAIRPPVEVGEARFEFGLAETPVPIAPVYELPGLVDEWAAAAVTLSLGGPNVQATAAPQVTPAVPAFTPAAFTGDAAVGYAFSESSRLGFSMQLLDLLTARAETAESGTAVVAAAQPPAVPLPPAGTFFEPDPLLLDHWTTHQPPPPALPSSLDLINNFLKRQPRLTRPGMLPPSPAIQADLSVRSTRAEPDLASETLARILVRQGKPLRAIEIYEKLMVKQPEKMAYFAAQIQSLQPPA